MARRGKLREMRESQHAPGDFQELLEALPKELEPVICGGQAVILLSRFFIRRREDVKAYEPLTSKDLDLAISPGSVECLMSLRSDKFTVQLFRDPRQPLYGVLFPTNMPTTRVDILKGIHGLNLVGDRVFEHALFLDGNLPVPVLNPVSQYIAKAANCGSLPQRENGELMRNDVHHLRIMTMVLHAYLTALVEDGDPASKAEQRAMISQLKQIQSAAGRSSSFYKGLRNAGVQLEEAIPLKTIHSCPLPVLKRFVEETFVPWMHRG